MRISVVLFPYQYLLLLVILILAISWVVLHCGFNYTSLITSDVATFEVLTKHSYIFWKASIQSILPI